MAIIGTVLGNIGGDARVVTFGETQALQFSVASKRSRKGQNGGKITDWMEVLYFRTGLQPYLTKGRCVQVVGEMEFNTYQTRTGETRVGIKVIADRIDLIGGPESNMEQAAQEGQPQQPQQQYQQMQTPPPTQQAQQAPQQFPPSDGGALPF